MFFDDGGKLVVGMRAFIAFLYERNSVFDCNELAKVPLGFTCFFVTRCID